MTKALKRKDSPTLAIDIDDQFAWMRVLVALARGGEPRKMDQALATISSESLGILHELRKQPIAVLDLQTLSRALNLRVDELARMPGAASAYRSYFADPVLSDRQLRQNVFYPAGHYRTAAASPGLDRVLVDLQRTIESGAFFAGMLLVVIARLEKYHPEVPASLNRSIAVLEAASARGAGKLPSNLKQVWKQWRHLAPLWAAYAMEHQHAQGLGLTTDAAGLEIVHDPARLRRILGGAKWFQSFAESFAAERARSSLLPHGEALQIVADVDELAPDLKPLSAEDLDAAKAYLAPTSKYNSQT